MWWWPHPLPVVKALYTIFLYWRTRREGPPPVPSNSLSKEDAPKDDEAKKSIESREETDLSQVDDEGVSGGSGNQGDTGDPGGAGDLAGEEPPSEDVG